MRFILAVIRVSPRIDNLNELIYFLAQTCYNGDVVKQYLKQYLMENLMHQIDSTLTFAQLNENIRKFMRSNNCTEVKVTLTGSFPIAKEWNAKLVKKEKCANTLTITDAKVVDINSLWCTVAVGTKKFFVKITGCSGSYTISK